MTLDNLLPLFGFTHSSESALVIAGPCSAESAGQVMQTARGVAACGVKVFRAGAWKPRTRPGQFEGVGEKALPWLKRVQSETGMVPMLEVATSSHLRMALRSGIEAFWIGARTSANPFAVQEIADTLAELPEEKRAKITMLVKNPVNPDLELWIGALQRIYQARVRRLGAVLRGFSSYGEHLYRNIPEWRIAFELHRRIPELPLICDPSHIAGRRDLVLPLARQAMCMGFDGLIIEVHCCPQEALSDSAQQITPDMLAKLMAELTSVDVNTDVNGIGALRGEIDDIDDSIMSLLSRRMSVAREIGALKNSANLPVLQPERYKKLIEQRLQQASRLGLSDEFVKRIFSVLHEESVRQQVSLRDKL